MIRDFGFLLAIGVVVMLVVGIVVAATTLGIREYKEPTGERKVSLVERITVKLGSLPTKLGAVFIAAAVLIFGIGIIVEGGMKIESDPLKWVNPDSPAVQSVHRLEDETGFSTTMGVLVQANNVADQDVVDVLHQFVTNIESRDDGAVVATSSLVTTMMKILDIDGATPLAPRAVDVANAAAVAPRDVQQALFHLCDPGDPVCDEVVPEDITVEPVRDEGQPVMTATQVNMRLAPASLDVRAELVTDLQDELDALIAQAGIEPGSVLLAELDDADAAIKATPSGLAVVGTGLLENLTANRAGLTYLALAAAALWLVIRLRSLARAFFTLIPVGIAVGASSIVIGGVGLTLSPMTTVSGPLVIATCVEFSVLITARYLEERQRGLDPEAAGDRAAGRTGRAFFTSAATTIGGFAVLIGSALPLLRDFGIIVTLNVAIALLAALVVMPPLVKWADGHGWLGTGQEPGAVKLAAPPRRNQLVGAVAGFVLLLVAFGGILVALDRPTGAEATAPYSPISLPAPPEPEPEDEEPAEDEEPDEDDPGDDPAPADDVPDVDPDDFGDELSAEAAGTTIGPILHGLLTAQDVDPHVATCTVDTLMSEYTDAELLAMGAAQLSDEVVAVVTPIASACGIDQATIDAVIEAGL